MQATCHSVSGLGRGTRWSVQQAFVSHRLQRHFNPNSREILPKMHDVQCGFSKLECVTKVAEYATALFTRIPFALKVRATARIEFPVVDWSSTRIASKGFWVLRLRDSQFSRWVTSNLSSSIKCEWKFLKPVIREFSPDSLFLTTGQTGILSLWPTQNASRVETCPTFRSLNELDGTGTMTISSE